MTVSTKKLQEKLIRLVKGLITAWEEWLNEQEVTEK